MAGSIVSAFTATHPLVSQGLLWYALLMAAALLLWICCKPRIVDEDERPIPAAPGPRAARRRIG